MFDLKIDCFVGTHTASKSLGYMEIFTEVISAACPHHLIRKAIAQETLVRFLGWEDPLEKEKATHSSNLAWRIPWREEPGRLQSMGLKESDTI